MKEALKDLREVASELGVGYKKLLNHLITDHYTSLDNANAHLARELDHVSPHEITSMRVGNKPYHIVRELSQHLSIRRHSVVTFLIRENLLGLRNWPDTYPGLERLRSGKAAHPQITLYDSVWDMVEKHAKEDLQQEDVGEPLPNAEYVRLVFGSLPTAEILKELSGADLVDFIEQYSGGNHPVLVSDTTHAIIKNAAATMQVPMIAVASYVIWNEVVRSKLDLELRIDVPFDEIFPRYREALRDAVGPK
jgi:hypothetical protein